MKCVQGSPKEEALQGLHVKNAPIVLTPSIKDFFLSSMRLITFIIPDK